MVLAFPALTVVTVLLGLDRYAGMHFFTNGQGGNMMNYANLFWIWRHPEAYILILPAFGVFSEVISTFSGKRLFGYRRMVYAVAVITLLSFTVWEYTLPSAEVERLEGARFAALESAAEAAVRHGETTGNQPVLQV